MTDASENDGHLSALRALVGERHVSTDANRNAPYLTDWAEEKTASALAVVFPGDVQEVSDILRYSSEHGLSVVPQGGNTGLAWGCYIRDAAGAILLNLKRMNRIRALDALNFTVEVDAGCIVQQVQEAVAEQDRLFPLSFGAQGSAQIGGAVATNAGGLNVLRYGMTRDLLLGLEVVLPDGRILNRLSGLRKDNRGVDLKQLFVGSEGALGVITAATLKLYPRQNARETALLGLRNIGDVLALHDLTREHCADLMSAFEMIPRSCVELALGQRPGLSDPLGEKHDYYVLLDVTCSGPLDLHGLVLGLLERALAEGIILDGTVAASSKQAAELWAIREAMIEAILSAGLQLRTDISVSVSNFPAFIDAAEASVAKIAPDWTVMSFGHVADGNVHLSAFPPKGQENRLSEAQLPKVKDSVYEVVDRFHGSISAEHGIGRMRREAFEKRQDEASRELALGLKGLLDPKGLSNPGCLFPETGGN